MKNKTLITIGLIAIFFMSNITTVSSGEIEISDIIKIEQPNDINVVTPHEISLNKITPLVPINQLTQTEINPSITINPVKQKISIDSVVLKIPKVTDNTGIISTVKEVPISIKPVVKGGDDDPDDKDNDVYDKCAVIICGTGHFAEPHVLYDGGTWASIAGTSYDVYMSLKKLGYTDETIYWVSPAFIWSKDIVKKVDAKATKRNVEHAFTGWLAQHTDDETQVLIHIFGHGAENILGNGIYMINPIESTISSDDFANWLDGVSYSTCTIVIDTCHAAAFIPDLSKENRIILAGATGLSLIADNVEQTAHRLPFSKILYKTLSSGVSYGEAWMTADQYIYEATGPLGFPVYRNNNPQIDDNGDGKGHGTILPNTLPLDGDGGLALKTYP